MACDTVGETNPDIGGIGIVIAFAVQAVISTVLSGFSFAISNSLEGDWKKFWKKYWRKYPRMMQLCVGAETHDADEHQTRSLKKMRNIADGILLFASDTQTLNGIALLVSGLSQIRNLDLYHLHILYDTVSFTSISNCAAIVCSFQRFSKHIVTRLVSITLLLVLYLAFTIAFCVRLRAWNETQSGHCYITSKISHSAARHPEVDYIYVALTSIFLVGVLVWAIAGAFDIDMRVVQRNPSSLFSSRYAVDVTSYFRDIRARLSIPIIARIVRKLETYLQPEIYANGSPRLYASSIVLFYAFLQLPLHLYSVIALRATNQSLLEGDSENAWGFGQVVALVMVLATLTECWKGVKEWYDWRHEGDISPQNTLTEVQELYAIV